MSSIRARELRDRLQREAHRRGKLPSLLQQYPKKEFTKGELETLARKKTNVMNDEKELQKWWRSYAEPWFNYGHHATEYGWSEEELRACVAIKVDVNDGHRVWPNNHRSYVVLAEMEEGQAGSVESRLELDARMLARLNAWNAIVVDYAQLLDDCRDNDKSCERTLNAYSEILDACIDEFKPE